MAYYKFLHVESGMYLDCGDIIINNEETPLFGGTSEDAKLWNFNPNIIDGTEFGVISININNQIINVNKDEKLNAVINGKLYTGTVGSTNLDSNNPTQFAIIEQSGFNYIISRDYLYLTMAMNNGAWEVYLTNASPVKWTLISS